MNMQAVKHGVWMIIVIVFSVWGSCANAATLDLPAISDGDSSDYRPGATNPVSNPGRFYLMKDDMLCTLFGKPSDNTLTINWNKPTKTDTDTDLTDWTNNASTVLNEPDYGNGLPNGISPTALAAGRINGPEKDDVVGAFYYLDGQQVKPYVFFVDNPELNTKATGAFEYIGLNNATSDDSFYNIAIAVGDLDRKLNADGEYNDEIVVVFSRGGADASSGTGVKLWVAVLNKHLKLQGYVQTDDVLDWPTDNNIETYPIYSVALGDYDGDGADEIAIGFRTSDSHGGNQKYAISTFCCDMYLIPNPADTYIYSLDTADGYQYNVVDLTSGDFNGDGTDEIAVAISSFLDCNYRLKPYVLIFSTDKDLNLKKESTWHPGNNYIYDSVRGCSITSGLFKYDPTAGYTTARRQIAMVGISWSGSGTYIPTVMTLDINDDFEVSLADFVNWHDTWEQDNTAVPKITSGNFKGTTSDLPTEQLAISWCESKHPKFAVLDVDDLKLSVKYEDYFQPGHVYTNDQELSSVPIVAADRDGSGYYLGAPIHISISQYLRPNYIMQAPPQHLDYLPDESGQWQLVRVSRNRNFFSSFSDSDQTTFESTHETRTNFDIGGSEKYTSRETVEALWGCAAVTFNASEKLAFDYNSVTSDLDGQYSSVTSSFQYTAADDDYLQVERRIIDIWRYRIYGLTDGELNGFYEVVMPSSVTETSDTPGCALYEYYRPIHENGNILSYPQIGDQYIPEDLGSFTVCDPDGTNCEVISSSGMTGNIVETWGGRNPGSRNIGWQEDSWSEEEKSQTKKLNFNADLQIGFHAKAYEIAVKEKFCNDLDLTFHLGKSWSTTDYSKTILSSSKGVSVNIPSNGDAEQEYEFAPVLYATLDGTLKLAYAVDPFGTGDASWWKRHYRGQPDLSLNLPMKFRWISSDVDPDYLGTWYVNDDRQLRSRMRRLFILHNKPTEDAEKRFLGSSPTVGDTIYVLTTVYNYSLDTAAGPFNVYFNYAEFDSGLANKDPGFDQDLTTNLIGVASVDGLAPLAHKDVYVKWEIPEGLGGDKPHKTGKSYVFYVTLDPENQVENEFHELYAEDQSPTPGPCPTRNGDSADCGIFCGSNNQGYWPWDNGFTVYSKEEEESKSTTAAEETDLDVSIEVASLELQPTSQSEPYGSYIFTSTPYRLKVNIVASETDKTFRDVDFYDNDRVFSIKRAYGLNPGDNDFYCQWTPETCGHHTLKVKVFEHEDDPVPGNNTATLDVFVQELGTPRHR